LCVCALDSKLIRLAPTSFKNVLILFVYFKIVQEREIYREKLPTRNGKLGRSFGE